jgi:Cytochrome c
MTRQSRARWLAFATAVLVVLLAALFAWLRNLAPAPRANSAVERTLPAASPSEAGRAAFVRAGCAGCHSAEGRGNPSAPLDGVGGRLDRDGLRAAAFASGEAARSLPAAIVRQKRAQADDPAAEALLDYLQGLK